MTDAPEHIHLKFGHTETLGQTIRMWQASQFEGGVEYVRVDLTEPATKPIEERMVEAGMVSLEDLVSGKGPLEGFLTHTAVNDIESFRWWIKSKAESFTKMRMSYELGDKPKDDGMYEWVFAHSAAFKAIHQHFEKALADQGGE